MSKWPMTRILGNFFNRKELFSILYSMELLYIEANLVLAWQWKISTEGAFSHKNTKCREAQFFNSFFSRKQVEKGYKLIELWSRKNELTWKLGRNPVIELTGWPKCSRSICLAVVCRRGQLNCLTAFGSFVGNGTNILGRLNQTS